MAADFERILISEAELERRIAALAMEIEATCAVDRSGLTVVAVLTGAVVFLADLIRRLTCRVEIGYIAVSSYTGAVTTPGLAVAGAISLPELRDRDVLIVDDILDTGGTLRLVQQRLRSEAPRSLRTVVLARKPGKAPNDVVADFVGFDVDDAFVVGYGLDYDGQYRNLPYIAELRAGHCG